MLIKRLPTALYRRQPGQIEEEGVMTATMVGSSLSPEVPDNKRPFDWRKGIIIVAFCAIPLTLLVVFTYLPFGQMVGFSFYRMKYIGVPHWVGLQNYRQIVTRPDILPSLKLSLYYMAGSVLHISLALYLATILSFRVRCGNLFKGLFFFPYLINGIAVGFIFKFFYTRGFIFDNVLQWCGFSLNSLPYWLKDQSINNWSLVGASVWRYMGQTMILFIGAIMSIDQSLYEAAEIDGANKFQQFLHIILPSIKTILVLNVVLSVTGALSVFEIPFVITTGANGTGSYFVLMDRIAHTNQKVGLASAMAVVLLIVILIFALLQQILFKFLFRNQDDGVKAAKRRARRAKRQRNRIAAGKAPLLTNGRRQRAYSLERGQ